MRTFWNAKLVTVNLVRTWKRHKSTSPLWGGTKMKRLIIVANSNSELWPEMVTKIKGIAHIWGCSPLLQVSLNQWCETITGFTLQFGLGAWNLIWIIFKQLPGQHRPKEEEEGISKTAPHAVSFLIPFVFDVYSMLQQGRPCVVSVSKGTILNNTKKGQTSQRVLSFHYIIKTTRPHVTSFLLNCSSFGLHPSLYLKSKPCDNSICVWRAVFWEFFVVTNQGGAREPPPNFWTSNTKEWS